MTSSAGNPTAQRFSGRVETYIRSRPGYPAQVMDALRAECGMRPEWVVADVGSGTGLLSELFLKNGNQVYGVEPNDEMREASEKLLQGQAAFRAVKGSAEATALADKSVNLVTVGQAFHWFDQQKAREEFARILRPGGWTAILFNTRDIASPLVQAYERLLETYGTDYLQVRHENISQEAYNAFYGPQGCRLKTFKNAQTLDYEGLKGRLLSSSFVPNQGEKAEAMVRELGRIFREHERGGTVVFEYVTEMHYGRLSS
ncbi:MAG: class I SAM-dependent methyltransferase [Dehalococcoidia bacterium]|nr:class I SAM-dependent methyltransferase [Dehalococcoidia bacterium]